MNSGKFSPSLSPKNELQQDTWAQEGNKITSGNKMSLKKILKDIGEILNSTKSGSTPFFRHSTANESSAFKEELNNYLKNTISSLSEKGNQESMESLHLL